MVTQNPVGTRHRRPSRWWFAVGGVLVVAAAATFVVLLVHTLRSFGPVEATVPDDGRPHAVTVGTGDKRAVWRHPGTTPDCAIIDVRNGRRLPTLVFGGSASRSNGTGAWEVDYEFAPGSGHLQVTCRAHDGPVQIGRSPHVFAFVGGIFATILIPMLLGGIGVLVLIITAILTVTGRPRDNQNGPPGAVPS